MKLVQKKIASKLYYRKRFQRLTSHDQVNSRELRRIILILLFLKMFYEETFDSDMEEILDSCIYSYVGTVYAIEEPLSTQAKLKRTIDSLSPEECPINFRFMKQDLGILLSLLRFPESIVLNNRSRCSGEEIFLRGLYELVTGSNQERTCQHMFGGVGSDQSRAFTFFIDYIYDNFHHLVHNNLDWWYRNGFFANSTRAIELKLGAYSNMVSHFIDCNCLPTSVVGGGPAEAGANAVRWDDEVQRSFYNGWKSIHGLKHQTVDNAYGLTVDMCGPTSLRRNDLAVLRMSNINERFALLQRGSPEQYVIFGDSAYHTQSHLRSYYRNFDEHGVRGRFNTRMKKVRIAIEWNYGYTASLFNYLLHTRKLKVLQSHRVSKIYTVVTLLRNMYIGMYGGQSSNYFQLSLPNNFVEKYLKQEDF